MRLLAPILLAALPAVAQEAALDWSPGATEACLAAGEGDCAGRSAQVCMEVPDGQTTVGMGFCLTREWAWWDERLNAAFEALLALDAAEDAEMKELGASAPPKAPALRQMQRAWIAYRDALCDYERTQWGGGTGQGPATAHCLMHETARQTLLLERRLAYSNGQ